MVFISLSILNDVCVNVFILLSFNVYLYEYYIIKTRKSQGLFRFFIKFINMLQLCKKTKGHKVLYKYNIDGEFVGEFPSNPDGYIPNGFTDIQPPTPPSNHYVRWNGSNWETPRDWRGTILYEQRDGYQITWHYKKAPDLENMYVESPPPPNDKSRWNGERWVYCSKARRLQAKIDRLGVPVIMKGDTAWEFDLLSQWSYQVAENQRRSHDNKCIVYDAFGDKHRLSVRTMNDLQKRCFNAFIGEK